MTRANSIGDISKDTTTIYLSNNKIDCSEAFAKALEKCVNLQTLDLSNNKIDCSEAFAKALEKCVNLQTLYLSNNNIGTEGAISVAKALEKCVNLQTLYLYNNKIDCSEAFAKALEKCVNLQTLNLSNNNIGTEGAISVAKALEKCVNLQTLDLSNNNIGTEGAISVAKALEKCVNLQTLYLYNNKIDCSEAFAKALEKCVNLQTLNLSNNNIGTEGAISVAKALEKCVNLQTLDLSNNKIDCSEAFAKALEKCVNLQTLDLSNNNIGTEGAISVAKALEKCVNLQTLNLSNNNIGTEGAISVAKALEKCVNLQTLYLYNNKIDCSEAFAKALEKCVNLQSLYISDNNIGTEGAKAIAKSLHKARDSVKIYSDFGRFYPGLSPKELFAKVCAPEEDIDSSADSCFSGDPASEPSAEPESEHDNVGGAGRVVEPCAAGGSSDRPGTASVSFADVVQLAKEVFDLRGGLGETRGSFLQTAIGLLKDFTEPVIQGYFGQVKLRQVSGDIQISKERLDALQVQIRASPPGGLHDLVQKRDAERERLRSLLQDVYPWLHAKHCESDEDFVCKFKERLVSLIEDLDTSDASVTEGSCADDFEHSQELVHEAEKCIEEYTMNQEGHLNNIEERSERAVESVISRATELNLGHVFWIALRRPGNAAKLEFELSELQNSLQEELEVLKSDTFSVPVSKILYDISETLQRVENFTESSKSNKLTRRLSPEELSEIHEYVLLGSNQPDVTNLELIYEKLDRSRRAMEGLKRAKDSLQAASTEKKRAFYRDEVAEQEEILSQGTPIELSKAFRHKLAETLQHAQEYYPELLKDQAWLGRIHVSAEGVFEVASSDLWLVNVQITDFQPIGDLLASRGGKTVQKVLDSNGKTLVLKQFQLGHPSHAKTFYTNVANLGKVFSHHVIRIIGAFVDTTHGVPRGCIVMPFYEQGSLAEWIEKYPHEDKAARDRLAIGLLVGVADLHSHDIVHCDIKPENIFLSSNGTPLLGDFDGIKTTDCTATFTSLYATPRYAAPELQSRPVDRFETPMDMYSVGVVLEELYSQPDSAMQDLIKKLKAPNPKQRMSAREALQHEAFGVPEVPVQKCLVCIEEIPLCEGTSCEKGHFICRDCIVRSVEAAAQPHPSITVDADGTMVCMTLGCDGRITGQAITHLAPKALNHLLLIAKMKAEEGAAIHAEQVIQRRMAEILQLDGLALDAQRHLQYIQEKILNAYCPSCNACFDTFDGCCAVKCGNTACGQNFCAWCLGYCSEDSDACHRHVATCSRKLGKDPFYPDSFEQVREAWRLLRAERLREYWHKNIQDKSLPSILGAQLLPLLTPDIVGTGFRLE